MRTSVLSTLSLLTGIWSGVVFAVQHDFVKEENVWNGHRSAKLTQREPYNLRSPVDYFGGPVYMRYECIDKPGENPDYRTEIQMCTWIGGARNEYCGAHLKPHYYRKGVYYWDMKNGEWFQHKLNGTIDWTTKVTVRAIHRYKGGKWLGICDYCCNKNKPPCTREILDRWYLPTKYKVHVVMVRPGDDFVPPADWDGCPFPGCTSVHARPVDMGGGFYYAEPKKKSFSAVFDFQAGRILLSSIPEAVQHSPVEIIDMRGKMIQTVPCISSEMEGVAVPALRGAPGAYLVRMGGHSTRTVVLR